eukprot:g14163.t1
MLKTRWSVAIGQKNNCHFPAVGTAELVQLYSSDSGRTSDHTTQTNQLMVVDGLHENTNWFVSALGIWALAGAIKSAIAIHTADSPRTTPHPRDQYRKKKRSNFPLMDEI